MRRRTLATLLLPIVLGLAVACGGDDGYDPFVPDDNDDGGGDTTTPPDTSTTSGDKPDTLPHIGSVGLYSSASPLNQVIAADPEIDPGSATMMAQFATAGDMVISFKQYSAPIFFADSSTPKVSVALECGSVWEMGVTMFQNVPVPPWSEPANDTDGAPIGTGCAEDGDQDNHMVVLDLDARCEYDFWQMRKTSTGGWSASWANSISLDGDGIYDAGLSTRGSGFAFPGGLIWPDELESGQMTHALIFNYTFTRSGGPVLPATDSDGITDGDNAIPEGALLQLDPSFDVSGLSGYELTIAKGLQKYGMYLADTGGESGIGLYAIDPKSAETNPFADVFPDVDWPGLPNIPLDRFRVIKMSDQDGGFADKIDLIASGCGTMS